jgi:hypothetical protein
MFIVIQGLFFLDGSQLQPIVIISDSISTMVYAILSAFAIVLIDVGFRGGFSNGSN